MKEQTIKKLTIGSLGVAGLGIICLIVKLIESFTREAHEWATTFLVLGFVFLGIALVAIVVIMLIGNNLEKKQTNTKKVDDEELLKKYKSKK